MTAIYDSIPSAFKSYLHDIPKDTFARVALQGSFNLAVLLGNGLPLNFASKFVAGPLATLIYGLVTPVFKEISNSSHLSLPLETARTYVAVLWANSLAGPGIFGNFRVSLIANIIFSLFLNDRDVTKTNWIFM